MMTSERGDERLDAADHPRTMRLQRFLARAGVASRRGSEDLMTAGRVTVNGQVVTELGSKVDPAVDRVAVDGVPARLDDGAVTLVLNKPAGYLTTMRDPQGRACVAELAPCGRYPGLFPVGRLDKDTTGLLVFTTDGDLAQRLLHPSNHVWKTYEALVDGEVTDAELDELRAGIELDDGPCQPAICRHIPFSRADALWGERGSARPGRIPAGTDGVEVRIREGRKNQVRRMLARIGHEVIELNRSAEGALELTDLPVGAWRMLDAHEVELLQATKAMKGTH